MRPVIVIPMGDPAGIGPEIVVKTFNDPEVFTYCRPFLIGDKDVIEQAMGFCNIELKINLITDPSAEGVYTHGTIDMLDMNNVDINALEVGQVQALAGRAAFEYIEKSVEYAMNKTADAIATTPINKESLRAANVPYIGHTEILGDLAGVEDPLTMFEVRNLRVFFLSRHVSLRQACDLVTKERLVDYIQRCTVALKKLGIEGKMAIAGLNPHSGENGLFGDEEVVHVMPAIEEAQAMGYDVVGPIGADSVFHLALQGRYEAVLSLYHDQGHIATKTLDFERTIAITNGMPFLRTSVDHGTALDIAGKNIASAVSLIEAVRLAAKYAPKFTGEA